MELIAIIISGLALLAASVCLILLVQETKRNQKRNAAMLQLIETECKKVGKEDYEQRQKIHERVQKLRDDVDNLMKGIVPDYNEAVEAKNAVDNFSRDIANLLNFDPLAAAKDARMRRRNGGEVSE